MTSLARHERGRGLTRHQPVYSKPRMIGTLVTVFAGLLGLAFGSFLNVCLSRWPEGESVVHPPSHCRSCGRRLAWWENVPIVSWMALGGRCRSCRVWIGWRTPLVELAVGALWAVEGWRFYSALFSPRAPELGIAVAHLAAKMVFDWLLVALAGLDAEHLWLPDLLTLPGVALGFLSTLALAPLDDAWWLQRASWKTAAVDDLIAAAAAAALILLIRFVYWLVRRREGVGLGDAKLMALLGAWLGLPGALLAFFVGIVLGAVTGVTLKALPNGPGSAQEWARTKLPLGTFLSVGGVVSSLWGKPILEAYLRWSGF